jgi:predicted chitinase
VAEKKQKDTVEEKFKILTTRFKTSLGKDIKDSDITNDDLQKIVEYARTITVGASIEKINDHLFLLNRIVKDFNKIKPDLLDKARDAKVESDQLDLDAATIRDNIRVINGGGLSANQKKKHIKIEKKALKPIEDRLEALSFITNLDEQCEATKKILEKCEKFLKGDLGVKKLIKVKDQAGNISLQEEGDELSLNDIKGLQKQKNKKEMRTNLIGGLASALTGSALPAMIPSGIRNAKDYISNFKSAGKKEKLALTAQAGLGILGFMTGSSALLMGASHMGQKANAEKQKKSDRRSLLKLIASSKYHSKKKDKDPNYVPTARSRSGVLSPDVDALVKILAAHNPSLAPFLRGGGFSAKNGGYFGVQGGNEDGAGSTISNLKVHAGESVKVVQKEDPVVKVLEKTNAILEDIRQSNKDMMEDAAEAEARKGLLNKSKSKTAEKTDGLVGKEKEDEKDEKGGKPSLLKSMLISKGSRLLSKIPKVGGILGAATGAMSDATPVYVVNASEMGGGGLGGVATSVGGMASLIPILTGTAMVGAVATMAYQAYKTNKDLRELDYQKDTTSKSGIDRDNNTFDNVKAAAIAKGFSEDKAQTMAIQDNVYGDPKDRKGILNGMSLSEYFFGTKKQGATPTAYAVGGSFETNGPHSMLVGEAGRENVSVTPTNKPMPVIIKDDKSKLAKEQLSALKRTDKFKNTQPIINVTAGKDEESAMATPMAATGSTFGSAISTGFDYIKSAVSSPIQTFKELKSRFTKSGGKENEALMLKELTNSGITDPKQQAIMMGQLAHESGGFTQMRELASGDAYEGRSTLGNTQQGDGRKFKGRGFIQLTGRSNYAAAGKALGLDLVNNPELAAEPKIAAKIATWYTMKRVDKKALAAGDVVGVTKSINGGVNGLDDRIARTQGYMEGGLAKVIPKNVSEGSIANIKNNAANGSEGINLKNREVATDLANKAATAKGTQQAINNITVGGSAPAQTPTPNIFTGDQISYAARLAKAY